MLGLKFRESFGKAVYIDKILPNTEAARLKRDKYKELLELQAELAELKRNRPKL